MIRNRMHFKNSCTNNGICNSTDAIPLYAQANNIAKTIPGKIPFRISNGEILNTQKLRIKKTETKRKRIPKLMALATINTCPD